jgi:hypothetical protein
MRPSQSPPPDQSVREGGDDPLAARQMCHQRLREVHQRGAGGNLVVHQDERADRTEVHADGAVDEVGGGVAVRLLEAAEQGVVGLLAGRVDEVAGEAGAARQFLEHALAQAHGGFRQADHQHRARQVGWHLRGEIAHRGADQRWRRGNVAAEHLGDDQKGAPRIAADGEVAQRLERPQRAVHLQMEGAGGQRDGSSSHSDFPELVEGLPFFFHGGAQG